MLRTLRKVRSELVTRECSGSASLQVFPARIDGGSQVIHFRDVAGLGFFDDSQAGSKYFVETLRSARAGVDDRDIVWFVHTGPDVVSNQKALSSSLESDVTALLEESRSDERVLLIGKDGGIKSRESSLDLDAIFRRIDAMPMRIREMRAD